MNDTPAMPQSEISWQDKQPYSTRFNDVYFSSDNGLLETQYVFLKANQLENRWPKLNQNTFTIIETGFGTGLNFLMAVQLWHQCFAANKLKHAKLHFISIEKYPLSHSDFARALAAWPILKAISTALIDAYRKIDLTQYPQTITLNPYHNIDLTLHIDDVANALTKETHQADAWFLDGFAPAKNPEMWQASLFTEMAKRSHQATTFATYTSAGVVRRGLSQAGFSVNKQAGFGKKREMLFGNYAPN